MQSGDAVVGLDGTFALGTLGVAVAFDPMVRHGLRRLFGLDVSADAGSRSSLDAPFVHRVLADCQGRDKKCFGSFISDERNRIISTIGRIRQKILWRLIASGGNPRPPKGPESGGQSDKWVERRLWKTQRNPAGLTERRCVFWWLPWWQRLGLAFSSLSSIRRKPTDQR